MGDDKPLECTPENFVKVVSAMKNMLPHFEFVKDDTTITTSWCIPENRYTTFWETSESLGCRPWPDRSGPAFSTIWEGKEGMNDPVKAEKKHEYFVRKFGTRGNSWFHARAEKRFYGGNT